MAMRVPEISQQFRYQDTDNGGARLRGMQVQTSQAMFGGSGAQALAEAGKNLRAFGARLADDVERWDRMVAEEAFVKRQKEETDFRLEQNKRQGRNALGARDGSSLGVSDASRQWASQTRNRFTSDMSRNQARLFGLLSDRADAQLFAWAGVKEQREEQVWKTSELEGRIEEASNRAAAMYKLGDMDAFRSSQAEIQQAVREMGELQGWDEKATTQKSLNAMGEALMPIAQGLVADGNTGAATAFIKEHAPALGAKRVLSLQSAIKAEQRRQAAEARAAAERGRTQQILGAVQQMFQDTQGLSPEERSARVYEMLARIPDFETRAAMERIASGQLAFEERRLKAGYAAEAFNLYEEGIKAKESPLQFLNRVNSSSASEAAKALAIKQFRGEIKEGPENIRAMADLRTVIDRRERNGQPMDPKEIYSFAYDNKLTTGQLKSALQYLGEGGNLGALRQSDVNTAWLALQAAQGKKKTSQDVPSWLYEAVSKMLPAGKAVSPATLKPLVAQAIMAGWQADDWVFRGSTYGQALVEGRLGTFNLKKESE